MTKKRAAQSRARGNGGSLDQKVAALAKQDRELATELAATTKLLTRLTQRVAKLETQVQERLAEALGAVAYGPQRELRAGYIPGYDAPPPRRPWYARAWASITRASAAGA